MNKIFIIIDRAIYILRGRRHKPLSKKRRIDLKLIHKISVSTSLQLLLAISVKGEYALIMETYKRLNLILFLKETFKNMKYKPFKEEFKQK